MSDDRRRPRVAVVGSGPHFLSGISYYTHHLSAALAAKASVLVVLMRRLIPARWYPGGSRVGQPLVRFEWPAQAEVYDGVDWWWLPSVVPALWRLLRFRPQVVVLQWWTGAVLHTHLLLAVVARMVGAKVVVEFHEVQDVGELAVPVAGAYVRAVLPLLLRLASGFVIHSEFDRTALRERYPLGDKEVALIPHALYNSYRTDGETADGDHPGCRFLYFGVIRPFKGVEDLVTAFETVAAADPAAELTVVGETWEGWTLPGELIERSSHRDRITFVNRYVSDEDVAGYFAAADVIVLPYHRSSSSGPLHIAMSTGKPVVLTRVGGLVEAAADYEGVVWVTPRDPAALADGMRTASELRGTRFGAAGQVTFADAADRYFDFFARLGVRP